MLIRRLIIAVAGLLALWMLWVIVLPDANRLPSGVSTSTGTWRVGENNLRALQAFSLRLCLS